MTIQHYFNSSGEWIAFRRTVDDRYMFDRQGNWIAWFPWNDNEAVDIEGNYLGTIVDGNRFYRRTRSKMNRSHPGFSVPPGPVGSIRAPGYAAYSGPPLGFDDVILQGIPRRRPEPKPPRKLPPPKPSPFKVFMSRLGLGDAADKIERMLRPGKAPTNTRPKR